MVDAHVDLIYRWMLWAGETGDKDNQTNQKICRSHERRKESSPRGRGGKRNRVKLLNSQIQIISNEECHNMVKGIKTAVNRSAAMYEIDPTHLCGFLPGLFH